MGIHFISKSWRAPLQLIDSWLPVPTPIRSGRSMAAPLLSRFVRAGWLRTAAGTPSGRTEATTYDGLDHIQMRQGRTPVRLVRTARMPGEGGRLVISGRLADVCAELDRLAAMERPSGAH